jgi:hypothetical protein
MILQKENENQGVAEWIIAEVLLKQHELADSKVLLGSGVVQMCF